MREFEQPSSSVSNSCPVSPTEKNMSIKGFTDAINSTNIDNLLCSNFEGDSKSAEKRIFFHIRQSMNSEFSERENREHLHQWLTFIGLNAQNIRHLELCSIIDFHTLMRTTHSELRSLADRGRFDAETKRKLLQSTVILQSHCSSNGQEKIDLIEGTPGPSGCSVSSSISTPNTDSSVPTLTVGNKMFQSSSMTFANSPKSPKTGSSRLVHAIPHKWHRSTKFRFSGDAVCHFCQRPLGFGFLNAWEKCRSCKWKVHTQCKGRVGDSCGLTPDHLRFLFDKLIQENNGGMWKDPQSVPGSRSMNEPAFQFPDQAIDSSSSTNSSAPSTPALPIGVTATSSVGVNPLTAPYRSDRKFLFPDADSYTVHNKLPILVISEGDYYTEAKVEQIESEGTIVGHDSTGSAEVQAVENQDKFSRNPEGHTWVRHTWNMSTIRGPNTQASWNEVTIALDTIEFNEQAPLIGHGRFGKVLRGFHYGDVAIKMLNMDHISDPLKRAEEFKLEVSAYKNTRHDNIALFLGYFMSEGKFGLVMSLCKGEQSLYALLHVHRERFDMTTSRRLAQQICQGVSYLHTKKILHKDLRSKNVMVESKNKVVITDFGMLSMKRLCFPKLKNGYLVPKFWASYISPEMATAIRCNYDQLYGDDLPFTEFSDVYAFGTIWFEMLTGIMPFANDDVRCVIYSKGKGIKDALPEINCSTEMKEIITNCWHLDPKKRPSFVDINSKLTNLLRKTRVDRSPSFPAVKSYESTF